MLSVRSLLLLVSLLALLAASVTGQTTTCASTSPLPSCITLYMTTPSDDRISVTFTYDSAGDICDITAGSIVQAGTGYIATIVPQAAMGVGTAPAMVTVANSEAQTIVLGFQATLQLDTSATPTLYSGSLGSASDKSTFGTANQLTAAYLVFNGFQSEPSPNPPGGGIDEQIDLSTVTSTNDFCTSPSTNGDPHFSGFHGQQFEVFGFPGAVLNILTDYDMQLNARLVELAKGDCMTKSQMKLVRLASGDSIPQTKWFDHEGSYMGEAGLAIQGGHRLYAKAGGYQTGFETVTLDGEEFSVNGHQVIGSGKNAVVIKRVNAHQVNIRTAFVAFSLTNSDKFLNVEPVRLVQAYDANVHPFSGALGQTADANFTVSGEAEWQTRVEQSALVASADLFDMSGIEALSA